MLLLISFFSQIIYPDNRALYSSVTNKFYISKRNGTHKTKSLQVNVCITKSYVDVSPWIILYTVGNLLGIRYYRVNVTLVTVHGKMNFQNYELSATQFYTLQP